MSSITVMVLSAGGSRGPFAAEKYNDFLSEVAFYIYNVSNYCTHFDFYTSPPITVPGVSRSSREFKWTPYLWQIKGSFKQIKSIISESEPMHYSLRCYDSLYCRLGWS